MSSRRKPWLARSSTKFDSATVANLRRVLVSIAMLAISGCMTVEAVVPEPAPVSVARGGSPIGLAQVRDARSSSAAGTAGAVNFTVGKGIDDYLRSGMARRLANLNFAVLDAPDPTQLSDRSVIEVKGKVILLTMESAEASTFDAIMAQSNAEVRFAIEVYDPSGNAIFRQHYRGTDQERLGVFSNPMKAQGRILAAATDQGLDQVFQDGAFITAIH